MTIQQYQEFAKENWQPGNDEITFALGLAGETGEVLDIIKKARRDQKPIDRQHLAEELGDVCWYIANLCTAYNLPLEGILAKNVRKLNTRYGGKNEE